MRNFFDQFAAAVAGCGERPAVEVQRRDRIDTVTYRQLDSMAGRIAAWLQGQGVQLADRCAILAENDAHWCATYLGILRVGAIAVPLDTAYKAPQVARLILDCEPRIVFTTPRHLEAVIEGRRQAARDTPVALLHPADGTWPDVEAIVADTSLGPVPECPSGPADPAVILYTSGTTSDPKGVVLTHGNLLAEREGAFAVVSVDERDCVLGVLPLFHALAQMANLLLPFSIGARVVFLESVNTTELLRALSERGVTVFACVPQFFYLIHQRVTSDVARANLPVRLMFRAFLATNGILRRIGINAGPVLFARVHRVLGGRMRLLITGGSRFDPEIGADLYRMGFNIMQAYGLTETSGAATLMRPGDPHLETVGQVLPGSELRILPPDTAETGLSDGEIAIRGPIVMAGYYNRPDATAAVMKDGWFLSGDLGRIDDAGRLTITGRKKEIIVLSSGKNIYPEEIEAHYRQSPFIKELCVLGLTRPDEPSAERLYAVVVPDPDVLREKKIVNAGDLIRFEMEGRSVGLPAHKRVLGYEVWMEPLPRTTTGKLKRFEIERRVRDRQAASTEPAAAITDADREWSEREDVAPILAVIQKAAREGRVARPDANLELDLGLDSMERVELLTALEQRFGADVPEEDAQRIFTVRELVEAIGAHRVGEAAESGDAWATILATDPPHTPELDTLLQTKSIVSRMLFVLLRIVLFVLRLGLRLDIGGIDRLPSKGPYLICPNHQSYLDAFALIGSLPMRVFNEVFFVGASEYFETPLMKWIARELHVVPVDPDASLVPAMQAGAFGLRHGRVLVLFPEGERSIDGTVRAFKKGAAILSDTLGVPIVPVALDGLHDVWPRNRPINWRAFRPWARQHIVLEIGAPLAVAAAPGEGTPRDYTVTTARLRSAVEEMWGRLHAER
jgi:long-chain acyl-CoA synthetase